MQGNTNINYILVKFKLTFFYLFPLQCMKFALFQYFYIIQNIRNLLRTMKIFNDFDTELKLAEYNEAVKKY